MDSLIVMHLNARSASMGGQRGAQESHKVFGSLLKQVEIRPHSLDSIITSFLKKIYMPIKRQRPELSN